MRKESFMKKNFKTLCKLVTVIVTVGGIFYAARDQIKAMLDKIKEVSSNDESVDDDFDEPFDDNDDDLFPESAKDDRDYVSINITNDDETEDNSVSDEVPEETDTISEEDEAE